jgi:hypothetical protein
MKAESTAEKRPALNQIISWRKNPSMNTYKDQRCVEISAISVEKLLVMFIRKGLVGIPKCCLLVCCGGVLRPELFYESKDCGYVMFRAEHVTTYLLVCSFCSLKKSVKVSSVAG